MLHTHQCGTVNEAQDITTFTRRLMPDKYRVNSEGISDRGSTNTTVSQRKLIYEDMRENIMKVQDSMATLNSTLEQNSEHRRLRDEANAHYKLFASTDVMLRMQSVTGRGL